VVGQNAVTPYLGRPTAIFSASSHQHVGTVDAVHVDVDESGETSA
jgi:hypothetical protein